MATFILSFLAASGLIGQERTWNLDQCIDYALSEDIFIKRAENIDALSAIGLEEAKSYKMPTINGTSSNSWTFGSTIDNTNSRISRNSRANYFALNADYNLYAGGQIKNQIESSTLARESSKYSLELTKKELVLDITNRYLSALLSQQQAQLAESQHQVNIELYNKTNTEISNGLLPEGDIYEIEARMIDSKKKLSEARADSELALMNLAVRLNLADFSNFKIKNIFSNDFEDQENDFVNRSDLINSITESWPGMRRSLVDILQVQKELEVVKGNKKPVISLYAQSSTFYSHIQGIPEYYEIGNGEVVDNRLMSQFKNNFSYEAGLKVNIPILNRRNNLNIQKSKIDVLNAELNYDIEANQLKQDILRILVSIKKAKTNYLASVKLCESTRKAYEIASIKYDQGIIDYYELNSTLSNYEQSQESIINEKYTYIFRIKILEVYLH